MPESVINVIQEYIKLEGRMGGYEAAEISHSEIETAYGHIARLCNTRANNIAFTENATASYIQALSAIPFKPDDIILTTCNDYVSNQIQFLSLQSRIGVKVVRAPDLSDGGVDVRVMQKMIEDMHPKLVCVTQVPTSSGLVQDVETIGKKCREKGILYLVDACQSVGQMRVDVEDIACDFLSATSRKFLRGPRGSGFLYVSDRVLAEGLSPLFIDLRGARWVAENEFQPVPGARRFETWEFSWALVLGTGEAARYALALGMGSIKKRVIELAERLREGLRRNNKIKVLDRGKSLSGIVTCWIDGWDPSEMVQTLRKQGINTSSQSRQYALIDYDQKGVSGSLRLSPHYYNTEEEIDQAMSAIQELV
jgi:selenocysteine lyase/cysteine desulfurase